MARWSKALEGSIYHVGDKIKDETFMKSYFKSKLYIPQSEQEQREFDDFSFIASAMAIMVHVALADGLISLKEKTTIIDELVYQVENYPKEYETLSTKFGDSELEVIQTMFRKIRKDILDNETDIDETISMINDIYHNNPYKKRFLIRLAFSVALADKVYSEAEFKAIEYLALSFDIEKETAQRIENEVRQKTKAIKRI